MVFFKDLQSFVVLHFMISEGLMISIAKKYYRGSFWEIQYINK